jgi:HPt (histidine-containing phosphotransfer) domain-containing protein
LGKILEVVAPDIVPQRHSFPSSTGAHAAVDPAILDRLSTEVGQQTVREMCTLFLADLDGRIGAMRAAIETGDARAVVRGAHGLASAARLIGARCLADMCSDLDRRARSGVLDDQVATAMEMVGVVASKTAGELGAYLRPPEA